MVGVHVENGRRLEALDLSQRMYLEGLVSDKVTVISILGACASKDTHIKGKQIHATFWGNLLMKDCRVCNAVMSMYGKAGSIKDARTVFDLMEKTDIASWNAMIACYVKNSEYKLATLTFEQMQDHSIKPSTITFITILFACESPDALIEGRRVHSYIVEVGFESDVGIGEALISMYGICGAMEDAHKVFTDLPHLDAHKVLRGLPYQNKKLWTSVAKAYLLNSKCTDIFQLASDGHIDVDVRKASEASVLSARTSQSLRGTSAPEFFARMQGEKFILDKHMCASILSDCATSGDLKVGNHLHAWILSNDGLEIDSRLWNALTNLYGKCGSVEDTHTVFSRMPCSDAVSWTVLIEAYAKRGDSETALQLFQQMRLEGVNPDAVTLAGVFGTCSGHSTLMQGTQLHACIEQSVSKSEALIGNALINMYAKCGSPHSARRVFDTMGHRDLSSWNVIIMGYARCGQIDDALYLVWLMQKVHAASPNVVTLVSVLSACGHAGLSFDAWNHFSFIRFNYGVNAVVEHYNSLIDAFGRSGRLDLADELVKNMPCQPNVVSWMAFLGASCRYCVDLEKASHAANIILEMDHHSLAPHVLLANVYASHGQVESSPLIS